MPSISYAWSVALHWHWLSIEFISTMLLSSLCSHTDDFILLPLPLALAFRFGLGFAFRLVLLILMLGFFSWEVERWVSTLLVLDLYRKLSGVLFCVFIMLRIRSETALIIITDSVILFYFNKLLNLY